MDEGVHLAVDRGDAIDERAGIFLRGNIAVGDFLGGLDRSERCQFDDQSAISSRTAC